MGEKPQISFIVINHNSRDYISACLDSIENNCQNINFEIIIVNNDNSFFEYSKARIINSRINKGFGSACNLGAKSASGKILCFLNPDTEIADGIEKVADYFDKHRETGIIGPKLETEENKIEPWCAGYEIGFWNLIRNNLGIPKSKKIWDSKSNIECDRVSGTCLFIRKELFDILKGFDEKFFMYFEDDDLCKRTRKKGYKVTYFPDFSVRHFGGKSFSSKFKQKKLFYKSMFYYFKKHLGRFN